MSVIIGQMRVALGADLETNKIFVRESVASTSTALTIVDDNKYDVCGKCVFYCNTTATSICGFQPIHV